MEPKDPPDRSRDTFNNMSAIARSGFGISTSHATRDVRALRQVLADRFSTVLQHCKDRLHPYADEVETVCRELQVINASAVLVRSTYTPLFVDSLVTLAKPEGLAIVKAAARASGSWQVGRIKRQRTDAELEAEVHALRRELAQTRAQLQASLMVLSAPSLGVNAGAGSLWERVQRASLAFRNADTGLGLLTVAASVHNDEFEQKCATLLSLLS